MKTLLATAALLATHGVLGQPLRFTSTTPALDKWMYPHNAAPCDRPASSTFATRGDASGVDTLHSQHLVGWDTEPTIPSGRHPTRYLIRSASIRLTINRGNLFKFDPTPDLLESHFDTDNPAYAPDLDEGRPVEIYGLGFRNGFTVDTFEQCAGFGGAELGRRNAYAAGWSANGSLVDISNHYGKTNKLHQPFQTWPFAVGMAEGVEPGKLVPPGCRMRFDFNLSDPGVVEYLQTGLAHGKLRWAVVSRHENAGPFGAPSYPDFVTKFNPIFEDGTQVEIEATLVRDLDTDTDGLPDDWEEFWLGDLSQGPADDPDGDGFPNQAEQLAGTNPAQRGDHLALSVETNSNTTALSWRVAPSRRYTVESSADLRTWTPVNGGQLTHPAPGHAVWRGMDQGVGPKFYRVRCEPTP